MPDPVGPSLERLLVDTLAERAERVTATVTLERVQARLAERQRQHRRISVRRPFALLGLAAAVVLPMAAFVAGQRPDEPVTVRIGGYETLIQRREGDAWLVVAMRSDGQARVVTSVPIPDPGDERRRPPMAVSPDGWLAAPGATGWELRHLRAPDQVIGPIVPFQESESGRAWVGGGRFAAWDEAGEILLLEPDHGAVERASVPAPLADVIAWTSDGTALVTHDGRGPQPILYWGERRPADWRVLSLAGGSVETAPGDLRLGWRSGAWWRSDGSRVQLCDMAVRGECPGLPNGAVITESPAGSLTTWYTNELAPDDVVDAVFGTRGLWVLLDRRSEGRQVALARVGTPGEAEVIATWDAGSRPVGQGSIEGVAPDDSFVVADSRVIDARTGSVTSMAGSFLGFVASATADGWPGDAFRAAQPMATAPAMMAYPTLRPLELVLAEQLTPGDRLLWREEHTAVAGNAVSASAVEIGPIEPGEGLGVFLVCAGPSDVLVAMRGPDGEDVDPGPLTPLLSRCLNGDEVAGGYVPAAKVNGPVHFAVTTSTDTAWQLVIFDPAPAS
jgi:hypothetical protein